MFIGSIPAVITPFKNNEVDYSSFEKIVEFLISNGSNGLVPCGTTGESPTLSHDEHKKIIEECIRVSDKRIPIIKICVIFKLVKPKPCNVDIIFQIDKMHVRKKDDITKNIIKDLIFICFFSN